MKKETLEYNKFVNIPFIRRISENIQSSSLQSANLKDVNNDSNIGKNRNNFNYKDFRVVQILKKGKILAIRRRISNISIEGQNNNIPLFRRSSRSENKENICSSSSRANQLKTYTSNSEKIIPLLDESGAQKEKLDLSVTQHIGKGRGISTNKKIKIGDMILEYTGELINMSTAKKREAFYKLDVNCGCYMFYFNWKSINYCLDSTKDDGRYGRLINHSKNNSNIRPVIGFAKRKPRIIFEAIRDIEAGEELLFDYNDTLKKSIRDNKWLLL